MTDHIEKRSWAGDYATYVAYTNQVTDAFLATIEQLMVAHNDSEEEAHATLERNMRILARQDPGKCGSMLAGLLMRIRRDRHTYRTTVN